MCRPEGGTPEGSQTACNTDVEIPRFARDDTFSTKNN